MKRSVSLFKRKKKKPASASAADDPPTTPTGGSRYAHPEPANETRVSGNPPSLSHGVIHHHHHQPHSQPQGPPNRASVVDSSAGEAQANSSRFSFSSTESEGKPTLMQRVREAASRKWGPMRRKQRRSGPGITGLRGERAAGQASFYGSYYCYLRVEPPSHLEHERRRRRRPGAVHAQQADAEAAGVGAVGHGQEHQVGFRRGPARGEEPQSVCRAAQGESRRPRPGWEDVSAGPAAWRERRGGRRKRFNAGGFCLSVSKSIGHTAETGGYEQVS